MLEQNYFYFLKKILDFYLGRLVLIEKIIKNHSDYDEIDQVTINKLTEEVNKYLISHTFLENLDQMKYVSVLKSLNS